MNKIQEKFYTEKKWYGSYNETEYVPTYLTLGIAIGALLFGSFGIAWNIIGELHTIMSIDAAPLEFLTPVFSHMWANIVLFAVGIAILCVPVRIRRGESERPVIVEKIRWAKDKDKKAADERKLYSEYKQMYAAIDNLLDVPNLYMVPGAWEKMNCQLFDVYDMLSMHQGPVRTLPMTREVERYLGTKQFDEYVVAPVRAFRKTIEDLVTIWSSSYAFNGLKIVWRIHNEDDRLEHIAESMGVSALIDSYFAGVPLEDVLA